MNIPKRIMGFALVCGLTRAWGAAGANQPQLPFTFTENRGEAAADVRFVGNGPEFKALFRDNSVEFQRGRARVTVGFAGAKPHPAPAAQEPTGAVSNYFSGSDPRLWITNLTQFRVVCYRDVWPGIAVRFLAESAHPKSEYVLAPGASIESIHLRFDGDVRLRNDGGIVVSKALPSGEKSEISEISEDAPLLYQEGALGRSRVAGAYRVYPDGTVGFTAGQYDRGRTLVVDPIVVFSGYFGDGSQTVVTTVAINSYNNIVVAGYTGGTALATAGAAMRSYEGGIDAFVAGFSPSGGQLLFCTYLGGSGEDQALGIAVDSSNNTYITGWTSSTNFPVVNPAQSKLSGTRDAFVTKLNAAGSAIVFSTYLGGSGADAGYGIALDSNNAPVIVGDTTSSNLPGTSGTAGPRYAGNQDAFVAKLAASGNALIFATYVGGTGQDHGAALGLDSANSIYIGGSTYSTNFPVLNAAQPHSGGGQDGFVTKLSASGTSFLYSTYYGGSGGSPGAPEEINALAIVPNNVVVAGTTSSTNFPVTAVANQPVFGGGLTDGFIGRFDETTGALTRSTYYGGSGDDGINALAVDFFGDDYIAGYTDSVDFPVRNALPGSSLGGMNAFVAKLVARTEPFSTCIGSSGSGSANALAIDSMTNVVVVGQTGSSGIPVSGDMERYPGGALSSFIIKMAPAFTPVLEGAGTFLYDTWHDTGYNGPNLNLNVSAFGVPGDIPIGGDWDGTGWKRIGVFRNGTWILDINGDGVFDAGDKTVVFGQAGDLPVVGDWNGTGRLKLGLFRSGTFILDLSGHLAGAPTGLSDATFSFGLPGDMPVAADWNQSGTTKVGVFRNGQWLIDFNGDQLFNSLDKTYTFGQAGDIPLIGDWDGSGLPKIGVYRSGLWILDYGGYNAEVRIQFELTFAFGSQSYYPLLL
jgi:hypothetical protein